MNGGFPGSSTTVTFCIDYDNLSNVVSSDVSSINIVDIPFRSLTNCTTNYTNEYGCGANDRK